MIKNKLLFVLGGLILLVAIVSCDQRPQLESSGIPWHTDPESAFAEAVDGKQAVLTFLYTDWCGYCRQMDQSTFQDPAVIGQLGSEYSWLRLNAETDPAGAEMRQRFGVTGFPTVLILDEGGDEIDRLQGFVPAPQFVKVVEESVSSPTSVGLLRKQAEKSPDDAEIQYRLAIKYMESRMYEKAGVQFSKVIDLDPENRSGTADSSLYYLAEIHFATQNLSGTLETLNSLQEKFPKSEYAKEAELMKAEVLLYRGEMGEAKKLLAGFIEAYPDHPSGPQIREILAQQ
ncbi:MAG TPA: thioredoxin fold domain-containing protein [Acidobacteriota bacterium]|nr:thioredoxin fold domain-containing protein [Acidobacteriota bacterium]